jgi:uncharacterized membrane protein HdeD (DUF308 family)
MSIIFLIMGFIDIVAGGLMLSFTGEGELVKFIALLLLAKGVWTILKTLSDW